mgnify:CR=1 FL=1
MKIDLKPKEKPNMEIPDGALLIGNITRSGLGGVGHLVLIDDPSEFWQLSDDCMHELNKREVFTAIIREILHDFRIKHEEFSRESGYSIGTIKAWSCGVRVPAFGTIKLLLIAFGIID